MERLENDVHLDNPLLDEITINYLDAFNLTRTMLSYLDMLQVDQLSEDEIAYIALHIMAALERYKEEHKPNATIHLCHWFWQCPDVAAQDSKRTQSVCQCG